MALFGGGEDRADDSPKEGSKQAMLAELEATCERLQTLTLQEHGGSLRNLPAKVDKSGRE